MTKLTTIRWRKRARTHGFLTRSRHISGQKVLRRRRRKGRRRLIS